MEDKGKFFLPAGRKLVEVSEEVYRTFYKMARRERYLVERDRANHVYSYNNLDGMIENGENVLKCNIHGLTVEDQQIKNKMHTIIIGIVCLRELYTLSIYPIMNRGSPK